MDIIPGGMVRNLRVRRKFTKSLLLWLLLSFCFLLAPPLAFGINEKNPKVIMVLIDKVTWEDLANAKTPFLDQLIKKGAVGLMSNRTLYPTTTTSRSYLTISAGNRGTASREAGLAFNKEERFEKEPSSEVFKRLTGYDAEKFNILHLGLPALVRENQDTGYDVEPGVIGEFLHRAGLKSAVLGNADIPAAEIYSREAAIIAMDYKGRADFGDISSQMTLKDVLSPYGVRANFRLILKKFEKIKDQADFVVIETGDTRRADSFQKYATPEVAQKYKKEALERIDGFLKNLTSKTNLKKTLLVIISPSPPLGPDFKTTSQLTPLILAGRGTKSGFLTSESTRRETLVTSTDIAPTILSSLKVRVPYFLTGRPVKSLKTPGEPLNLLIQANNDYVFADMVATPVIITFVVLQILALLFALLILLARREISPRFKGLVLKFLLAVLALPLVIFILPIFKVSTSSVFAFLAVALGLEIALVFLAQQSREKKFQPLIFLTLITTLFLIINMLFGAKADLKSAFGYSPIVAGRFYGMGNQSMSVLIGTTIISIALLLEQNFSERKENPFWQKLLIFLIFLFIVLIIGFPKWGANFGGTVTAVVAFLLAYLRFFYKNFKFAHLVAIFLALLIFISLFILIDITMLPGETHLGRTARLVSSGGFSQLAQIIERKLSANVRIFKYTSWTYLFLTIWGMLILLWLLKPKNIDEHFFTRYSYLTAGFTGGLIGGIVGALTNDSGISITALILVQFLAVIFYIMIYDQQASAKE